MKKQTIKYTAVLICGMILFSCGKQNISELATSDIDLTEPSMLGPGLSMTFKAGHSAETCVGQGLCHIHTYNSDGTFHTFHVPC